MNDRDRGQAAVEFAIALPLVAVMVLGIVQVLVVGRDQIAIELAAREAAREAATAASPASVADAAARRATSLRPLEVVAEVAGDSVTVTVRYHERTTVPIVGSMIGDVALTASVTMAREPP